MDVNDFVSAMISLLFRLAEVVISIVLRPLRTLPLLFDRWAATIGSEWWAPIFAVFIILLILVLVRLYAQFDEFLDLMGG